MQTPYPIKYCVHKNPIGSKRGESLVLPQIQNPKSYHQKIKISNKLSNYHQNVKLWNHHQSYNVVEVNHIPKCVQSSIHPISTKIMNPSKVPSMELSQQKCSEDQANHSNPKSTSSNPSSYVNYNHSKEIDAKTIEYVSYILNNPVSYI